MKNQTLISYAFLKVNLEQSKKRDYIENFIPIVAECIRISPAVNGSNAIVSADIQSQLSSCFGLSIPLKAIDTLLRRARRAGYITRNSAGTYEPNWDELEKLQFKNVQQQVIRMHETVVDELVSFANARFGLSWSSEAAETALYSFLDDTQILLSHGLPREKQNIESVPTGTKYVVSQFVLHLHDTHSGNLEFFETILKGSMLAYALYLPEPQTRRKFQQTYVYFDTTFLIYALGYSGNARQEPCIELIDMLYEAGAQAFCFEHTVDEIRDALYACASIIAEHRTPIGPSVETVQHFTSLGYDGSDIQVRAEKLETELARIRVHVKKKPDYSPSEHRYVPAEANLATWLSEHVFGANADKVPIDRDVASMSAVIRLRKGHETIHIEECRAVFATTNSKLAKEVRAFFRADRDEAKYTPSVPPCISDDELAILLWLKSPVNAPSLPRKRLIADTYAAVQPSERLWQAYIREIERLQTLGDLDTDDADLLRYASTAKSILMDATFGDEQAFTQATVTEVLERTRREYERQGAEQAEALAASQREENLRLTEKHQTSERRVAELEREKQDRLGKMRLRADTWARNIFLVIGTIASLFLVGAVVIQTIIDASDLTRLINDRELPTSSYYCLLVPLLFVALFTLWSTVRQFLWNAEPSFAQKWVAQRLLKVFLSLAHMTDEADAPSSKRAD